MDYLRGARQNVVSWLKPGVVSDSQILSKAAYNPHQYEDQLKQRGYQRDLELSNEDAQVYSKDGQAHVAYRGTSKLKDLAPDLDIVLGKRKHRDFEDAVTIAKKSKDKYGNVKVVGHSLGGTKAIHAAESLGLDAEVYNPGTSPFINKRVDNPRISIYKNPLDFISRGVSGKSVRWWRNPLNFNAHSL